MPKLIKAAIYRIVRRNTDECYVGFSVTPKMRWWSHRRKLNSGKHTCKRLQEAWSLHGSQAFDFEILEWFFTSKVHTRFTHPREQRWIKRLKACYNTTGEEYEQIRAEAMRRPEVRRKLAIASRGNKSALGHTLPEKAKRELSQRSKGNNYAAGKRSRAFRKSMLGNQRARGHINTPEQTAKRKLGWLKRRKLYGPTGMP